MSALQHLYLWGNGVPPFLLLPGFGSNCMWDIPCSLLPCEVQLKGSQICGFECCCLISSDNCCYIKQTWLTVSGNSCLTIAGPDVGFHLCLKQCCSHYVAWQMQTGVIWNVELFLCLLRYCCCYNYLASYLLPPVFLLFSIASVLSATFFWFPLCFRISLLMSDCTKRKWHDHFLSFCAVVRCVLVSRQ